MLFDDFAFWRLDGCDGRTRFPSKWCVGDVRRRLLERWEFEAARFQSLTPLPKTIYGGIEWIVGLKPMSSCGFDGGMMPSEVSNCVVDGDGDNTKGRCPEFLGIFGNDGRGVALGFPIDGLAWRGVGSGGGGGRSCGRSVMAEVFFCDLWWEPHAFFIRAKNQILILSHQKEKF